MTFETVCRVLRRRRRLYNFGVEWMHVHAVGQREGRPQATERGDDDDAELGNLQHRILGAVYTRENTFSLST